MLRSSAMIAPIYLNRLTQSSFSPLTLMSVVMPLVLLVTSLVFSALICMPKAVEILSRRSIKSDSSFPLPARPSMSLAKRKFVIFLPPMLTDIQCVSHNLGNCIELSAIFLSFQN